MSTFKYKKGDVFLRDFDLGIVNLLGATVTDGRYYVDGSEFPTIQLPVANENDGITFGTELPGIPVTFDSPDSAITRYHIPSFRIRREDPLPALERYHSLALKYRVQSDDANPLTINDVDGFDEYEEQLTPYPYDIPYTVTVESYGERARQNAQYMLRYTMKRFRPHFGLSVVDSLGQEVVYNGFTEGPNDLSLIADIRDRMITYALTVRIHGELDVDDPYLLTGIVTSVQSNIGEKID